MQIECQAGCLLLARRGDLVEVNLIISTQFEESWGTKTIKQRRLTDDRDRLIDSLRSVLLDMNVLHAATLHIYRVSDFLSHYFLSSGYYSKIHSQRMCESLMILHPHCTLTSHEHAYASVVLHG